jgi:uncharacterized protein (TIGR02646 family)
MRQVTRPALPKAARTYLERRQSAANLNHRRGTLNMEGEWKAARQTKALGSVLQVLRHMMGPRERCMYCVDSHGCDIEHFRPKSRFPTHAFRWSNLLLCCTECGRLKGMQFPTEHGKPLLIDPTAEDPWRFLDFDPDTGGLTARFDVRANDWSPKGAKTVEVLQLDRREALGAVYLATYRRLCGVVQRWLTDGTHNALALVDELRATDDHGLLPWCFGPAGQTVAPFAALRQKHPNSWSACRSEFQLVSGTAPR